MCSMGQHVDGFPSYIHIEQNDFLHRKPKKQKEEDIAVCVCCYDASDPDSACGERCLNVITSSECTPGYCPCDIYCKNQRFQKCEYAMTKLFKTEGRGWGLLADQNIKAGQFVIEYCGEVISWKVARRRSQVYEREGLKDAYIISLNAYESIDATRKGSLARFINHSCQPNCETRKWTVLGEIRVGIFAKQDILFGSELSYDYNFEWYGGAEVRCLCGATCCSGFLGAKSRGFQEAHYVWEDDDDRYSVENVPLYDSAEDELTSKVSKDFDLSNNMVCVKEGHDNLMELDNNLQTVPDLHSEPIDAVPLNSMKMEDMEIDHSKLDPVDDRKIFSQDNPETFDQKNAMISQIQSNSACGDYKFGPSISSNKVLPHFSGGRTKQLGLRQVEAKPVAELLASKEAQEEIFANEDAKNTASSRLNSLYDEIRPAIEEHERDSQDCVSTSVAEKWIEASCSKLKSEFDFYSCIIKQVSLAPRRPPPRDEMQLPPPPPCEGGDDMEVKYLEMGASDS